MSPLKACRFYERDRFGRLTELRWDEYLLSIDAMEKRPGHPYYDGRALIKIDPDPPVSVEPGESAD